MFAGTNRPPHVDIYLADFAEGMLSAEERKLVEDHLAGCAKCRGRLAETRALLATIRERRPDNPPAAYFDALLPRVRQRLADHGRPAPALDALFVRFGIPAAVTLLLVMVLLRMPFPAGGTWNSGNGLASLLGEYSSVELYDVAASEDATVLPALETPMKVTETVPEIIVSRELGADLLEAATLQSPLLLGETTATLVAELSAEETEQLVRRLQERTFP